MRSIEERIELIVGLWDTDSERGEKSLEGVNYIVMDWFSENADDQYPVFYMEKPISRRLDETFKWLGRYMFVWDLVSPKSVLSIEEAASFYLERGTKEFELFENLMAMRLL